MSIHVVQYCLPTTYDQIVACQGPSRSRLFSLGQELFSVKSSAGPRAQQQPQTVKINNKDNAHGSLFDTPKNALPYKKIMFAVRSFEICIDAFWLK